MGSGVGMPEATTFSCRRLGRLVAVDGAATSGAAGATTTGATTGADGVTTGTAGVTTGAGSVTTGAGGAAPTRFAEGNTGSGGSGSDFSSGGNGGSASGNALTILVGFSSGNLETVIFSLIFCSTATLVCGSESVSGSVLGFGGASC